MTKERHTLRTSLVGFGQRGVLWRWYTFIVLVPILESIDIYLEGFNQNLENHKILNVWLLLYLLH